MSQEQDKIFFRNFSLTLALIAVMMIAFYFVASTAVQSKFGLVKGDAATANTNVAELTKPVGQVVVAEEESESIAAEMVVADASTAEGVNGSSGESV